MTINEERISIFKSNFTYIIDSLLLHPNHLVSLKGIKGSYNFNLYFILKSRDLNIFNIDDHFINTLLKLERSKDIDNIKLALNLIKSLNK